ncbi:periplasmic heavy metal sensor [Spirosoma sp. HMF4905]|uniref:Periplasmic heavy metal sensor n=1 Tax=Spirosoma arboris TaxID=2682092 RepID=A0A7K1S7M5_9BACT|nr:periplasmic heavy metal sensor [Spirosoma arboris]MVM29769.1 periplasmic heavy metal sensor [Spirosoma arboris]
MERTKLLTFAVIGLLLLNLLTIGYLVLTSGRPSQAGQLQGPLPDGKGPARVIIERLHFDEQQQQQYLEMGRQHHQQTERLNAESIQLFQEYYSLLPSAQPDSAKANALIRQIEDVQRQIAELNFSHFRQIKALCRPDQQADFSRLVADLAKLFGQRPRPPRLPGDGPPDDRPEGPPENFPPHR